MSKYTVPHEQLEQIAAKAVALSEYFRSYEGLPHHVQHLLTQVAKEALERGLEISDSDVLFGRIDQLNDELTSAKAEIQDLRMKITELNARLRKPRVRVKTDRWVNLELEKEAQKVVENLGLNAPRREVPMPRITCGTPSCPYCTEG